MTRRSLIIRMVFVIVFGAFFPMLTVLYLPEAIRLPLNLVSGMALALFYIRTVDQVTKRK